jgi:hypothetical protein
MSRALRTALAAAALVAAALARAAPRGPRTETTSPFANVDGGGTPVLATGPPGYDVTYLYNLSTNFGPVPASNVQLSYDREHKELYITGDGPVRVFNDNGMETYAFGEDPEVGYVLSVASLEGGDLVALTTNAGGSNRIGLVRCTFRGEFRALIEPRGVPAEFAGMIPTVLRYQGGKIYLADLGGMRVLVLDAEGNYVAGYDVAALMKETAHRNDLGLRGFNVDREGNVLFTIQPAFSAYTMAPNGEIRGFGQKGSAPGKFNIVGGIARDDAGNYYVTDILKSAVLVFDKDLQWRKEFGYRGGRPSSLAAPEDLVAVGDRVFVSSRAQRGVSVFRVVGPAEPP